MVLTHVAIPQVQFCNSNGRLMMSHHTAGSNVPLSAWFTKITAWIISISAYNLLRSNVALKHYKLGAVKGINGLIALRLGLKKNNNSFLVTRHSVSIKSESDIQPTVSVPFNNS